MSPAESDAGAPDRPSDQPYAAPPVAAVEWPIAPGAAARGERRGAGKANALLLHAPGGDLDDWSGLPAWLARAAPCACWAFDLPGHGLSDDPPPGTMPDEAVAAVLAAASEAESGPWFVVAAGATGAAVLRAAPGLPLLGVVLVRPGPEPPAAEHLPRSPAVPKLAIVGASAEEARQARALTRRAGGWSLVSAVHADPADPTLLRGPWAGHVGEQIAAFLRDCLRQRR